VCELTFARVAIRVFKEQLEPTCVVEDAKRRTRKIVSACDSVNGLLLRLDGSGIYGV